MKPITKCQKKPPTLLFRLKLPKLTYNPRQHQLAPVAYDLLDGMFTRLIIVPMIGLKPGEVALHVRP